jgi:hypothetical protein
MGNIRLLKAQHSYPSEVLVLAIAFLLEVGVLEVEFGHCMTIHSLLDCAFTHEHTYREKVALFHMLEYKLNLSLFQSETFFFQLPNKYVQYAWYQLLSTVFGACASPLLDTSLVNIYEHQNIHWSWSLIHSDHRYSCPATML